jgi:NADH dehydrogenase (ubiquinone) 1 alpha subcomplex subunit 8
MARMASPVSEVTTEQLNVEELKVTSALLVGAAHHYGSYCNDQNDVFMGCRMDNKDPRKCLEEGKKVTACAKEFFSKIKETCNEEFTEYWTCLDYKNQDPSQCRKTQKVFDSCMATKLNIEKPKDDEERFKL